MTAPRMTVDMSSNPWNFKLLAALMALSASLVGRCDESTSSKEPRFKDIQASRPAPGVYATQNYGLTFHVPPHSFYCPLPAEWVGSDHGTLIFLEPPGSCAGYGFPSSARGFERDVARIEIFYGYDLSEFDGEENALAPQPCDAVAHVRFLGRDTPICKTLADGKITLRAKAKYEADARAEATFTLVTTAGRFARDSTVFQALLASARPCSSEWKDNKGRTGRIGTGDRCPPGATWF